MLKEKIEFSQEVRVFIEPNEKAIKYTRNRIEWYGPEFTIQKVVDNCPFVDGKQALLVCSKGGAWIGYLPTAQVFLTLVNLAR